MTPSSLEGQTLGKYRVLEQLGRGGMAQVYRAYHPQLERYVAIKVLRSDLVEEEEFLARFRREARAVAGLRHPHIVQVFDFDVQDDLYFMVMELLEGDTLKAYLNSYRTRGERMPLGEMLRILLDVLDGLAYAHSEGIIHRDIKPANVLLTRRGQAVVTDFGIAQIVGSTRYTMSGALMGTLNYMAPEQGLEGHGDVRSDIYSVGIVFYEMLTGRTPFDADTPLAILMKHLNDPLPLPRKFAPEISEAVERVILKALAKRPEDRYQSAGEMVQALQAASQEAGIVLPERVVLPQASQAPGSPATGVAVFSGEARQHITDRQFAVDDTDSDLARRLAAAPPSAASEPAAPEMVAGATRLVDAPAADRGEDDLSVKAERLAKEAESFFTGLASHIAASIEEAVKENKPSDAPDAPAAADAPTQAEPEGTDETPGLVKSVLGSVFLLVGFNVAALVVGGVTGQLSIFGRIWPVELALVALLLAQIMRSLREIWMLIPTGLVLGNAVIFGYCSITGRWSDWIFLWAFEPLLVFIVIFASVRLAEKKESAETIAHSLGGGLSALSLLYAIGLTSMGILVHVFGLILNLF